MKIKTHEDIEATIDQVFEALTDFESFELAALRRGAEVHRTDTLPQPAKGMGWQAKFIHRNRERMADIIVEDFDRPNHLRVWSKVSGLNVELDAELLPLSRNRTRMTMIVDMRPKTIPARLLIQSLKLARGTMLRRFRKRIAEFAATIESRYRT
ncbi:SRPBCC family protein [Aliiroseovarius sp. F20344]|uniref:SRPBCC family protein n=1 Tax=Aliiroseovarius sp. F20344 TaxID=2926414 RepID=UPI001FF3160D|nr:SRPBCC family protein [Aliiroseovarius sp. F20344]MCK0140864.1 SRPBCC family protein [Aliiroseovarius sp. F20344]